MIKQIQKENIPNRLARKPPKILRHRQKEYPFNKITIQITNLPNHRTIQSKASQRSK